MKDIKEVTHYIRSRLYEIQESIDEEDSSIDYCEILDRGIVYGKFEGMLEILKFIEGDKNE